MFAKAKEARDFLNSRNYLVGGLVHLRDKLRTPVNGVFLADDEIRELATYESYKDDDGAKPDGQRLDYMASACRMIAGHPSIPSLEADEGRELAKRWEDRNPETDESNAQPRVLCKRMAYFLTRNFAYLWSEGKPQ